MNYDGERKVGVEKGAKGIIGGSGNKSRLYVVFTVRMKIEDKKKKWRKWRRLLAGSYLQFEDLLEILWQVRQLERKKKEARRQVCCCFVPQPAQPAPINPLKPLNSLKTQRIAFTALLVLHQRSFCVYHCCFEVPLKIAYE